MGTGRPLHSSHRVALCSGVFTIKVNYKPHQEVVLRSRLFFFSPPKYQLQRVCARRAGCSFPSAQGGGGGAQQVGGDSIFSSCQSSLHHSLDSGTQLDPSSLALGPCAEDSVPAACCPQCQLSHITTRDPVEAERAPAVHSPRKRGCAPLGAL